MYSKCLFLVSSGGSSLWTLFKVFSFRLTGVRSPRAHAMASYPPFVIDIFSTVYAHIRSLNVDDRSSFYTEYSIVVGVLEQAEQLGSRQLLSPLLCLCSLLRYLLDAAQNAGATFSRSCVESYQIHTAPEALPLSNLLQVKHGCNPMPASSDCGFSPQAECTCWTHCHPHSLTKAPLQYLTSWNSFRWCNGTVNALMTP